MSNSALLLIVGGVLVVVGVLVSGGGRDDASTRVGNTGFSVFGSVTQTFHSVGMAIEGKRERTARDWIGWGLSASGLAVGLFGVLGT